MLRTYQAGTITSIIFKLALSIAILLLNTTLTTPDTRYGVRLSEVICMVGHHL